MNSYLTIKINGVAKIGMLESLANIICSLPGIESCKFDIEPIKQDCDAKAHSCANHEFCCLRL